MSLPPRLRARFERQAEGERRMSREQRDELAALLPEGRVRFDEPMAAYSAVAAGGPAEAFVLVEDVEELKRVLGWALERDVDYRFWGRGSALVVRDKGVRGLVVMLGQGFAAAGIERAAGDEITLLAGAATPACELAALALKENLAGLERLGAERGTVGGFICSGASAEGNEPLASIEELTLVTKDGRELSIRRQALRLEEGRLKIPRTSAVTRVLFRCVRAAAVAEAAAPQVELAQPALRGIFASPCRTTAAELIGDAGLAGVRVGGARVPAEDPNAIANQGKATVRDIAVLLNLVRDRVREQTGVALLPMIELIGDR